MLYDLNCNVLLSEVNLKVHTFKPLYLTTLIQIFSFFKTSEREAIIKFGFWATQKTRKHTFIELICVAIGI